MKTIAYVAAAVAVLSACEGTGEGSSPDEPIATPTVGQVFEGNITAAEFDPSTAGEEELRVQIVFAGQDALQEFTRIDDSVLGYVRFEQQEDVLSPAYTAFAKESEDGSVQAVVVGDGGQFLRFSGGTSAVQNTYVAPTGGQTRYEGGYVGLLNGGPDAGGAPDGSGSAVPRLSTTVTGHALINADFNNGRIEGRINDREYFDGASVVVLPEITLIEGEIMANGAFGGSIEQRNDAGAPTGVGSYSGLFGGDRASAVAGMVTLDGDFIEDVENEFEYGIFVLDRCETGTPACEVVTNP